MADQFEDNLIEHAVAVVVAYVSNNSIGAKDLPDLISSTHSALAALRGRTTDGSGVPEIRYVPAVSVRKSLGTRDHILSMIDGKPYRTLKRHISRHGMTPDDYRARYNLSPDYPMVAPAYSDLRRETAKRLGLGRKPVARSKSGARSSAKTGAKSGAKSG